MPLAALPPASPQAEALLAYETRSVHDSATVRFSDYRPPATMDWVIAVVRPAQGSGAATIPGGYVEAETGRFVTPASSGVVVMKQGHWQASAAGDPTAPSQAAYAWTEPLGEGSRSAATEEVYSPFARGGTIVFKPAPSGTGIGQFIACKMIFADWAQPMAEALRSPSSVESAAEQAPAAAALASLTRISTGPNAALATFAFRALLESKQPVARNAPALFKATDGRSLATFVYLSLVLGGRERPEWTAFLLRLVDETSQGDRLMAMAYAAFAVNVFAPADRSASPAARELMARLHQRVGQLGIPVTADSRWLLVFRKSGFG